MLMLTIVPIFAGLLACMPVPIGDPEHSRIDPELSGLWVMDSGDAVDLYLFHSYDKRSWLVVGAHLEEGSEAEIDDLPVESAEEALAALRKHPIGEDGITSTSTIVFKAWLTKLGGEQFMTWEPIGEMNSDGSFTPDFWYVFKLVKDPEKKVRLYFVDPDYEGFANIKRRKDYEGDDYPKVMRRTWERAIRKHAKDSELYSDLYTLHRVPKADAEKAAKLLMEVIGFD
jgi:hypothetical protein